MSNAANIIPCPIARGAVAQHGRFNRGPSKEETTTLRAAALETFKSVLAASTHAAAMWLQTDGGKLGHLRPEADALWNAQADAECAAWRP